MNNYEAAFQDLFQRVTQPSEQPLKISKKRQDILQAAKALFSEKGFSATTTAAIAKQAQTTEKTLFKHFPSKNDLVLAVIVDAVAENFAGTQLSNYLTRADLRQALVDFLLVKHKAWMRDPTVLQIFLQVILTEKDIREALISSMTTLAGGEISAPIVSLGDKVQNPDYDPNLFMVVLFGTMFAYSFSRASLLPDWQTDDEANIAKLVDVLLYGIAGGGRHADQL